MKVLGIVGSYRKDGIIDRLVSETLASAEAGGAETKKIYLMDVRIEYCRNCRQCTQKPGSEPGKCIHSDDMAVILEDWKTADALVIGSPVNFFNITAITRKFLERLVCMAYWPWGKPAPSFRVRKRQKKAVLITAAAMPASMGYVLTSAPRALRLIARTLGAKPVATIFAGLTAQREHQNPPKKAIQKARTAGKLLSK